MAGCLLAVNSGIEVEPGSGILRLAVVRDH